MNKKTIISTTDNTIRKLRVLAKKKEGVRSKLVVTAKEKEDIKDRLAVTAKQLAATAREKENIRRKLAVVAKEKESVRRKLAVTAKKLATIAMEKESIKRKLAVTAKKLAVTAEEKESVRSKLAVTAKQLAETAEEKEDTRSKLAVTAKQLAVTAETLRLKAKQLAVTAEEKEDIRSKLAVTAKQLAETAEEKEDTRSRLAVTAKQLAVTAREKENIRRKLAVVAKEKESVRRKLAITAKKLAVTAKEIESVNKELRSLDLAKDEFVSIASHQLRTPLTALKGYAGMLLDGDAGPINDKQREYLGEIKHANDRMIRLITALLNVSRVDLGVFTVDPEPVNFEEVSKSVLKELEMKIQSKKLRVETSFEKGIPLLSVDPKITRMIFQNLLTNAVKYTPAEGSISLNIKKDGSTILISVADTGCGIPKAAQSKIFTKLFRADNARTQDPEGTGLGLYIIKATIEQTGGKIWFESKENKGSVFYVSIPLAGMKKKEGSRRLE